MKKKVKYLPTELKTKVRSMVFVYILFMILTNRWKIYLNSAD